MSERKGRKVNGKMLCYNYTRIEFFCRFIDFTFDNLVISTNVGNSVSRIKH